MSRVRVALAFACPPDCGHCCTHLERDEIPGDAEFREILREHGVYHCTDGPRLGLSLSNAEADAMRAAAKARRVRLPLHPRTWLLETRRRVAVVLDWHMPRAVCPMYSNYQCTAYDARPLVCRAYPVLGIGKGSLAPECPKMPIPSTQLRAERSARRAIEEAHVKLDELANGVMATPRARFVAGLTHREASARMRRYRKLGVEEYSSVLATR